MRIKKPLENHLILPTVEKDKENIKRNSKCDCAFLYLQNRRRGKTFELLYFISNEKESPQTSSKMWSTNIGFMSSC